MPGPLSGVKIVELTGIGPGPFAAMLLSDMGAEIVQGRPGAVGRHGAQPGRGRGARPRPAVRSRSTSSTPTAWRRSCGSWSRPTPSSRATGPGVAERLGVGPDVCLARNPRLVYGRMTGWGQDGPLANAAGHDINYIALAGALAHFGRAGGKPTPPINLVGDFGGGGMLLAFGVVCAVLEARASGQGQVVDAAMVDGAAILMSMIWGVRAIGVWDERLGMNMPRHRCALLRHLRDRRRQVHRARLARAAVLRRVPGPHRPRRRKSSRAQIDREGADVLRDAVHRAVPDEDARRVVRSPRRHRRVLRAGAADERGRAASAHQGARHDRRIRRRAPAGAGAAVLAHAGRDPAAARRSRVSTPTKCSPSGASPPTRWPSSARSAPSRSQLVRHQAYRARRDARVDGSAERPARSRAARPGASRARRLRRRRP